MSETELVVHSKAAGSVMPEVQRVLVKEKGPGHLNFSGTSAQGRGAADKREGRLLGRKTTDSRSGGVNSDEALGHPARSENTECWLC